MLFVCFSLVEAAGGKALPCVVDVRDEQQINSAVEKAVERFGGSPLILTESLDIDKILIEELPVEAGNHG